MRIRTSIFVSLLIVLVPGFIAAHAQTANRHSGSEPQFNASARLSNGVRVAFANETEPPGAIKFALSFIETEGAQGIHRVFIDQETGSFFGYDVKVEPVANTRQIKVYVMPLSPEYERRLRERAAFQARSIHPDFQSSSLFQTQAAQLVDDGDMLAVDALVNHKTGVKIVEIIKASFEEIPLGTRSANRSTARDFSLDDIVLTMMNYRLLMNGELIAGDKPTGGCAGAILWFYLPGRGRFILSIRPHEGYDFQRVGVVENNTISFTIGGDQFQWISTPRVLAVNGLFNLWVLHDRDYQPESDEQVLSLAKKAGSPGRETPRGGLLMGAADRLEYLLPKK